MIALFYFLGGILVGLVFSAWYVWFVFLPHIQHIVDNHVEKMAKSYPLDK